MISFILIQNVGLIATLLNRCDPVRFEVVNNQRTSHPIAKLAGPAARNRVNLPVLALGP